MLRPFCERLVPGFITKPWACSNAEVPWADLGFEGSKLGYLIGQCGYFHTGHRAVEDCHALLEVLASPLPSQSGIPFAELLASSGKTLVRIWAIQTPYELKDLLKARGYRWSDGSDARPKAWWTEVPEDRFEAELAFLQGEIYSRPLTPPTEKITAFDRFRSPTSTRHA